MPSGKYFVIRSQLNGLVLDVEGACCDANTRVVTFEHHGKDNQLWYLDHLTGTLRNKMSNKCLDFNDNRAVIKDVTPGDKTQQWELKGDHICNKDDDNKVVDIVGNNSDSGAEICRWKNHGGDNQKWTFEHVEPKYFYVVGKQSGKVLDISGADAAPGVEVITWGKKDSGDNQLWYENRYGVLTSKLNDLVLDSASGQIVTAVHDPDVQSQWWLIDGDKIVNRFNRDEVLDVKGASTWNGANIIPFKFHGNDNQRWSIEYV